MEASMKMLYRIVKPLLEKGKNKDKGGEWREIMFERIKKAAISLMLTMLLTFLTPTLVRISASSQGLIRTYYPSAFSLQYGTQLVGGSLNNLRSDDDVSMLFRSAPIGPSTRTLFAHAEQINIGGTNYLSLKLDSADTSGMVLYAPAYTSTRFLFERFVYSLSGISIIQPSYWQFVYRARADYPVGAHVDVDIKVLTSFGAVRHMIAVHVADSPGLPTSWVSVSGGFSFPGYTVVDQGDYLLIEYYAHITYPYSSGGVYLDIDDSGLPTSQQTSINNVALPQDQIVSVEFRGQSNTNVWTELVWAIDSAWNASQVQVTFQLYNFTAGGWATSEDGYISYTSSSVPNTYENKNQTITSNPTSFKDALGNWKILITGKKIATSFAFLWYADFMPFQVRVRGYIVPDDFPTIQAAINAAQPGDVIFVKSGIYYENVVVNKTLTLEGEDMQNTIIDGGGVGTVVSVTADGVTVTGFTIRNGRWAGVSLNSRYNHITGNRITANYYGVSILRSWNIILQNNITNNIWGFEIFESAHNIISANNITNNIELGISIYDSLSKNNTITENNISNNGDGVCVFDAKETIITRNIIANNTHVGISLRQTNNNTISENEVRNNGIIGIELGRTGFSFVLDNNVSGNGYNDPYGVGILVGGFYWQRAWETRGGNILNGNSMTNNHYNFDVWGSDLQSLVNYVDSSNTVDGKPVYYWINESDKKVPSDAGYIALINCTRIRVENLSLTRNGQGILLASTEDSIITTNNITDNFYGITLLSSKRNAIYYNNFINNTIQVGLDLETDPPWPQTSLNSWDNGYPSGGNYWSTYEGSDEYSGPYQNEVGSDGIGDTPYTFNENNTDHYPLINPTNGTRPPPNLYLLTIQTPLGGGTTNPAQGTHAYPVGETATIQAIPNPDWGFDHWELDGSNIGASNPLSTIMDSNHILRAIFNYNVTIRAYCDTENIDLNLGIWMDGSQTSYTTPHTFVNLIGTHIFGLPKLDPNEHQFYQWNTGAIGASITIASPGTYTGHYRQVIFRFQPQNITVSRGQPFKVAVVIENVSNLYALQAQIKWDTAYLEYVSYVITVPVENYPTPIAPSPYPGILHTPTAILSPVIDPAAGTFLFGAASLYDTPSFIGSGTAIIITFKALNQTGITTLNLSTEWTGLWDKDWNQISYTTLDGIVEVISEFHDVAIENVVSSKTVVGQGYSLNASVTVQNHGNFTETFNVTLYADSGQPLNETGLVGYWSFDEGTGTTAYDSSGNNNHGTIIGATWTNGKIGNALQFDGIDDYVICGSSSFPIGNAPRTVSLWFKVIDIPTYRNTLLACYGLPYPDDAFYLIIIGETQKLYVGKYGGGDTPSTFTIIQAGVWYHAVATYDGTTAKIYLNGIEEGSATRSYTTTSTDFYIAGLWPDHYFNGIIDEVKVYNRALSAEEVWAEYTRTGARYTIGTQTVTLESGASTTLTFTWNVPADFPIGNYTLSAYAWPVPGETDTTDNLYIDGTVQIIPTYTLTITTTTGGTTNPSPGTYTHPAGTIVSVTAIPNSGYIFDHWELDSVNVGSQNPITITMNANHNLKAYFTQQTYTVTIKAHCNTEGVEISVPITMDGNPTGYYTPHTFTGLTGTHTFTVPNTDPNGHPFKQWSTGSTNPTITVTAGGTYIAYYEAPPPPPPGVGGYVIPVDKIGLLAPYIGLASTTIIALTATIIYIKRFKNKKQKQ